jgi:hypothetical protein
LIKDLNPVHFHVCYLSSLPPALTSISAILMPIFAQG